MGLFGFIKGIGKKLDVDGDDGTPNVETWAWNRND